MKRKNMTRNALFTSIISLLLCVSMLVGTTFAWFTDSVASGSNVIASGNLDIEVQYTLDGETWKGLNGADDLFKKGLWEPGHTEVVALRIENKGSLALKYTANMNIVNEVVGTNKDGGSIILSDILQVTTITHEVNQVGDILIGLLFDGSKNTDTSNTKAFKSSSILASEQELSAGQAHYIGITVDMPETVGNEANHKGTGYEPSIEFGINVLATQFTYEEDSFGKDYDKDAEMPVVVATADDLKAALDNGSTNINLTAGTYSLPASSFKEGTTLNCEPGTVFENAELNINGATVVGANFSDAARSTTVNGTFKDCTFTGSNGLRYSYAGNEVVFENCVFSGDVYAAHFDGGANEVIFRNCTFSGFNAMGAELTKATYENCTFVGNGVSEYNGINMWGDTEMINCTFVFDGSSKYEWIDLCSADKTATFTNCVVNNGTTTENVANVFGTYLTKRHDTGKIIVDGVEKK